MGLEPQPFGILSIQRKFSIETRLIIYKVRIKKLKIFLGFFALTGLFYIFSSILFFVVLPETTTNHDQHPTKGRLSIWSTYKVLWTIMTLPAIKELLLVIITYSVIRQFL